MAKYLDIKMATLMEEDFENEQLNLRAESFFMEDKSVGPVIETRSCEDNNQTQMSDEDYEDDRPSSLIEKDVDNIALDTSILHPKFLGGFAISKTSDDTKAADDTKVLDDVKTSDDAKASDDTKTSDDKASDDIKASDDNLGVSVAKRKTFDERLLDSETSEEDVEESSGDPSCSRQTNSTRTSFRNAFNTGIKKLTPPSTMDTRKSKGVRASLSTTPQYKSISFTLSVKDKFVTELNFFHPFSSSKCKVVNLGIFLATSRNFGDHFVYKISPLSPLRSLNLQPQDRIIKINNFDITGWSHEAVVNFVRHLPHNDQNRFVNLGKTIKFTFSMDYIPVNRASISSNLGPSSFCASLEVIMQPNGRTSIGSSSLSPISVRYLNRTSCTLLKLGSESNRYVKVEVPVEGEESLLRVTEGEKMLGETNANLILHEFDMTYTRGRRPQSGKIVALETFRSGTFLHAGNSTSGSDLSLISSASDIRNINTSDSRLFRIYSEEGNILSQIVNIQSGLYLKAENEKVTLEDAPITDAMKFRTFPC